MQRRREEPERRGPGSGIARPLGSSLCLCALLLATVARGSDENDRRVEEMPVFGEPRAAMDVLAGATTTRIDADDGLLEGLRLDELLSEVPGVQVRRLGGDGEPFEISIRGSTPAQVPVFLSGVRLESTFSRNDLSTICLDVLDEIQVTRGPGASRAGTGAIGGAVNLVPRPASGKPETRLRLAGGAFETFEGSVRHARRFGSWGLSFAYCGFHTDGDFEYQRYRPSTGGGRSPIERRDNNESNRQTALVQLERPLGPGRLEFTQLTSHLDRGSPGLESAPRGFADEEILSLLTIARFEAALPDAPQTRVEATLAHRYERNRFKDPEPAPARPDRIDSRTGVQALVPQLTLHSRIAAFGGSHEWGLLMEGRVEERSTNEADSRSRAGGALRAESTSHWLDDRLRVSPSLRLEYFQGLDLEWVPGLFFEADPLPWLRLKASASRSYRIPSFGELYLPDKGYERGNENLEPEEAWNFEVGTVLRNPSTIPWLDAEIEFTWFRGDVDQSITYALVSPDTFTFVNSGRSETRGYELTLRWRPRDWLRVTAARTVTEARLESNDNRLAGIAVSQVDGRVELGPRERFRLVGEVHYTGRIPLNSGGTAYLPSRVVFDASASVDLARIEPLRLDAFVRSLWLSLRGRNLGNIAVRDVSFRPRPGRNFTLSIEGRF